MIFSYYSKASLICAINLYFVKINKRITMTTRVYYDDTDAGGVMYHTNYIKYCERARSEMMFSNSITMDDKNGYFLVKSLEANYIKAVVLGDMIEIKTSLLSAKKASARLVQNILKNDIKVFEMIVTIVYMKDGKIRAIPQEKLDIIS
jgi:acyl-CoA thioester hydrolase